MKIDSIPRWLEPDGEKSNTRKTVALSLASIFNSGLTMIMSMILARVLSKTEMAAYNQANLVLITVFPFLQMGLQSGIYYVISRNDTRQRAVFNEALLCIIISNLLFALFLLLGGNKIIASLFHNSSISVYLSWIIPICFFQMLISIEVPVLVYRNRVSFNAKFNIWSNIVKAIILIVVLITFRTVLPVFKANSIIHALIAILVLFLIYKYVIPADDCRIKWNSIKSLITVSLPLGMASMVITLNSYLDKWIISVMCTPEEYAVFSVGAHEVPFITAITNSVMTVIIVSLTEACRDEQFDQAQKIINNAAEKTTMFLMPLMLVCLSLSKPLIGFVFSEKYLEAVGIFIVYLLYFPYWSIYYGPIMTAMGKPKAVLYIALAGLACNAFLSVFMVKIMGSIGASVATILTIYLVNLPLNLGIISKGIHVKWTKLLPYKHYGVCILLSTPGALAAWLVSLLLNKVAYFWQLAAGGIVFVIITVPIYVWHFKLPWRDLLNNILRKVGIKTDARTQE